MPPPHPLFSPPYFRKTGVSQDTYKEKEEEKKKKEEEKKKMKRKGVYCIENLPAEKCHLTLT